MSGEDVDIRAQPGPQRRPSSAGRLSGVVHRPHFRIGAIVAIARVAGLVAWLALRNDSSGGKTAQGGAAAMTPSEITALAGSLGHPIFWLGPKKNTTYEVTQAVNGKVYVRYLPAGIDVGSSKPYLTVATYPFPGTFAVLRKMAKVKGAVTARVPGGGVAVLDLGYPQSVHIAYPRVDYQVEVYDPTPARAMQLVSSGQLKRLGSNRRAV